MTGNGSNGNGFNGNGSANGSRLNGAGALDPIATLQLNEFLGQLAARTDNSMTARANLFNRFMDPRRSINDECGYPSGLIQGADQYRELFDRNPIAARVVQLMPWEAFRKQPSVFESESEDEITPFEDAWDNLARGLRPERSWYVTEEGSLIWQYVRRWVTGSRIGHFGLLLLGFDDGKNLDQPVDGVSSYVANAAGELREVINRRAWPTGPQAAPAGKEQTVDGKTYSPRLTEAVHNEEKGFIANARALVLNARRANPVASFGGAEGGDKEYDRMYDSPNAGAAPPSDVDRGRLAGRQGIVPISAADQVSAAAPPDTAGLADPLNVTATGGNGLADGQARGGDAQYTGTTFNPPGATANPQYVGVELTAPEYPAQPARRGLLFMRPFDESLVQIVQYEADIRNPRFGLPVMYRITLNDPREQHSGIGLPLATVRVHWSRVVHGCDELNSSDIFHAPAMRPVLNRLLDIDKIMGASAEGYWKACFSILFLGTHPQLGPDAFINMADIRNQYETLSNSMQRLLVGNGLTAEQLAPQMTDPTPFVAACIEAICIKLGCPKSVFTGAELAGIGDKSGGQKEEGGKWNDRVAAWQHDTVTPNYLVPLIDRLIAAGVLPEPAGAGKPSAKVANALRRRGFEVVRRDAKGWVVLNRYKQLQQVRLGPPVDGMHPVVNAAGKTVAKVIAGGYTIEWPDLGTVTDAERAQVALTVVQALAAFVVGNVESLLTVKKLFVRVLGWDAEEVDAMLADVEDAHAKGETLTAPPMTGGFQQSAPPGTQEYDDAQAKQDQLDSLNKGDAGGAESSGAT